MKFKVVGKKLVGSLIIASVIAGTLAGCGKAEREALTSSQVQEVTSNITPNTMLVVDDGAVDKSEVVQHVENPLADRQVFFAGYVDAELSKTDTVALENLPENEDFLMQYTITNSEDGSLVYETGLIPSGQCVVWIPGESLEEGTYELQFLASPYYEQADGNYLPLTAGSSNISYVIK